ncbi:MAG: hypothetical protein H0X73_07580 [Chthoniobacterales bacterium]|nr:hypothetical protein [Chthoniobacterales bacterium]
MKTIAVQTIALGFVIFLVSLPLVYRRIPMNVFYGIRIPAAFKSEQCVRY